jgi:tellurite resistance protein
LTILRYSTEVKLAGVVYFHRISDQRFGGTAAKNFRMFMELCGEEALKNVILVTNMWGEVAPERGEAREQQLKDEHFKVAIENGARLRRHVNMPESAQEILREILRNPPVTLKIQRELVDENKGIGQTGAGAELRKEIREAEEKWQRKIGELEESLRRATEDNDEQSRKELEEEKREAERELEKLRKDSTEMRHNFARAELKVEARLNANAEFREQVKEMREMYEAMIQSYEHRVSELQWELREARSEVRRSARMIEHFRERKAAGECVIA